VTMGVSLITNRTAPSSFPMAPSFGSRVPTPRRKTARLKEPLEPQMTLLEPY
jgi:hypothetical protein